MIRGLHLKNGNRGQNLVYKRQWGHCVLPRHTSSILGLSYAIQVSMEDDAMGEEKEREQKDVFRRAGHAWGGGGGMERERGVLV